MFHNSVLFIEVPTLPHLNRLRNIYSRVFSCIIQWCYLLYKIQHSGGKSAESRVHYIQ